MVGLVVLFRAGSVWAGSEPTPVTQNLSELGTRLGLVTNQQPSELKAEWGVDELVGKGTCHQADNLGSIPGTHM